MVVKERILDVLGWSALGLAAVLTLYNLDRPGQPNPSAVDRIRAAEAADAASRREQTNENATGFVKLENHAIAPVQTLLSADPNRAKSTDGASFLGCSFIPKKWTSRLHVRLVVHAYATARATVIVALFRAGQDAPVQLTSKTIEPQRGVTLNLDSEILAEGLSPVALDARIGVAEVNQEIVLNGPDGSAKLSYLEITESQE